MPERIIEAIIHLMSRMHEDRSKKEYLNLSKELSEQGYTESEIHLAFSWVYEHLRKSKMSELFDDDFFEFEDEDLIDTGNQILTPEAYGYLMHIVQLGILSDEQVEEVIEKALSIGTIDISSDEVKTIVANILFDPDQMTNNPFNSYFYNKGMDTLQ